MRLEKSIGEVKLSLGWRIVDPVTGKKNVLGEEIVFPGEDDV